MCKGFVLEILRGTEEFKMLMLTLSLEVARFMRTRDLKLGQSRSI